jgi:hypothetical protein
MALPANQINVPTDAPIGIFLTPNENPSFNTASKDVTTGGGAAPGSNPIRTGEDFTVGGVGAPINSNG